MLLFTTCNKSERISTDVVIGKWSDYESSDNCIGLELRNDYTYKFDNLFNCSCDIWMRHHGMYEIIGNQVYLYESEKEASPIDII